MSSGNPSVLHMETHGGSLMGIVKEDSSKVKSLKVNLSLFPIKDKHGSRRQKFQRHVSLKMLKVQYSGNAGGFLGVMCVSKFLYSFK